MTEGGGGQPSKTISKALSLLLLLLLPVEVRERASLLAVQCVDSCCCCCHPSLVTLFENMAHAVLEFDLLWAGSGCP